MGVGGKGISTLLNVIFKSRKGKGMISIFAPGCSIITHFTNNPGTKRAVVFRNGGFILHSVPSNVFTRSGMGVVNGNYIMTPSLFVTRTHRLRATKCSLGRHLRVDGHTRLVLPARHILSHTCRTTGKGTGMNAAKGNVKPACDSGTTHVKLHINSVLRGFSRGCGTLGTHRRRVLGSLNFASCSVARRRGL